MTRVISTCLSLSHIRCCLVWSKATEGEFRRQRIRKRLLVVDKSDAERRYLDLGFNSIILKLKFWRIPPSTSSQVHLWRGSEKAFNECLGVSNAFSMFVYAQPLPLWRLYRAGIIRTCYKNVHYGCNKKASSAHTRVAQSYRGEFLRQQFSRNLGLLFYSSSTHLSAELLCGQSLLLFR